jgi:transposase
VKAWLEEHKQVIAVHYLPSYSPELNPDERLNRSLKSTLSHLPAAKDERSLQKQIISKLRSCQKKPARIRCFFNSSSTLYAA